MHFTKRGLSTELSTQNVDNVYRTGYEQKSMKQKLNLTWMSLLFSKKSRIIPIVITIFFAGFSTHTLLFPSKTIISPTVIQSSDFTCKVCFTPGQLCLPLIIEELDCAKRSISMHAYSLTSKRIAEALIRAHKRGVRVIVLADKSQERERYTQVHTLQRASIRVYIDFMPVIAHNKVIIIDGVTVIGGSYNYSVAAEKRNGILNNDMFCIDY